MLELLLQQALLQEAEQLMETSVELLGFPVGRPPGEQEVQKGGLQVVVAQPTGASQAALLGEQEGGDLQAAEVAGALGQRLRGYPEEVALIDSEGQKPIGAGCPGSPTGFPGKVGDEVQVGVVTLDHGNQVEGHELPRAEPDLEGPWGVQLAKGQVELVLVLDAVPGSGEGGLEPLHDAHGVQVRGVGGAQRVCCLAAVVHHVVPAVEETQHVFSKLGLAADTAQRVLVGPDHLDLAIALAIQRHGAAGAPELWVEVVGLRGHEGYEEVAQQRLVHLPVLVHAVHADEVLHLHVRIPAAQAP